MSITEKLTQIAENEKKVYDAGYSAGQSSGLVIDDSKVGANAWSSKNIVDKLCPSFTESGAVVACEPFEGTPLEVVSGIVPYLTGSGDPRPDNVRLIKGHSTVKLMCSRGKNLLGGDAFADVLKDADRDGGIIKNETDKTISISPGLTNNWFPLFDKFEENTQYTIILYGYNKYSAGNTNICVLYTDGNREGLKIDNGIPEQNLPVNEAGYAIYTTRTDKTPQCIAIQHAGGQSVLSYEKCGVFKGKITFEDFEAYQGNHFTMDLGQTVYGGSLNWKTGVLTISYANRRLDRNMNWATLGGSNEAIRPMGLDGDASGISRKNTSLCTHFVRGTQDGTVGQFWTSPVASTQFNVRFMVPKTIATTSDEWYAYLDANEVMLCYEMAEPITVPLTPTEILALSGTNTLHSDTGDTTVTGKADLAAVVAKLQETLKTLLEG